MSFLELITDLLADPAAKDAYRADPQAWLGEHGLGDLTPAQIDQAVGHSSDALAPDVAKALGQNPTLEQAANVDLWGEGLSLERPAFDDFSQDGIDADPFVEDVELDNDEADGEEFIEAPTTDSVSEVEAPAANADTVTDSVVEASAIDDAELTDSGSIADDFASELAADADSLENDHEDEFADLDDADESFDEFE